MFLRDAIKYHKLDNGGVLTNKEANKYRSKITRTDETNEPLGRSKYNRIVSNIIITIKYIKE